MADFSWIDNSETGKTETEIGKSLAGPNSPLSAYGEFKEGAFNIAHLRSGGSGHVYSISSADRNARGFCVKVLRPERVNSKEGFVSEANVLESLTSDNARNRIANNLEIPHKELPLRLAPKVLLANNKSIVSWDVCGVTGLPAFVSERGISLAQVLKASPPFDNEKDPWIKHRIQSFWGTYGPNGESDIALALSQMLRDVERTLRCLHKKALGTDAQFHLDIKAENILMLFTLGPEGALKGVAYCLMDFGSMKSGTDWKGGVGSLETTFDPLPPSVKRLVDLREQTSDKRVRVPMKRVSELGLDGRSFDLHQLGRVVLDILCEDTPYREVRHCINRDGSALLVELAKVLLWDPDDPNGQDPARGLFEEGGIEAIERRIRTASSAVVKELGTGSVTMPGTSIYGYDERLHSVVSQPLFSRLRGVRQLGLTHVVYPGAMHTRFEHALGTFQTACDYLKNLLSRSGSLWLAARASEHEILMCALYALFHDIGHYSFAHYIEDTGVFPQHEDISKWILTNDLDHLGLNCVGDGSGTCQTPHPQGRCDFRLVDRESLESFHEALRVAFRVRPQDWKKWFEELDESKRLPSEARSKVYKVLGELVDGPIDADKFDYVRRDAAHCGFNSIGGVERDLLLGSLTVCADPSPGAEIQRYVLGVRESAHCALEQLALARYHLFSLVYWNAECRRLTAVFRDATVRVLRYLFATEPARGWKFIAKWCREGDDDAVIRSLLLVLDEMSDDGQAAMLRDRIGRLTARDGSAVEVAHISEGQKAAFEMLMEIAKEGTYEIEGSVPPWMGISPRLALGGSNLSEKVAAVVAKEVGVPAKDVDLVVDVPMQSIERSAEAPRCGVVRATGEVLPPGPIWDAIQPAMRRWTMHVRVFVMRPRVDSVVGARIEEQLVLRYQ